MKPVMSNATQHQIKSVFSAFYMAMLLVGVLVIPGTLAAQDFGGADEKVC